MPCYKPAVFSLRFPSSGFAEPTKMLNYALPSARRALPPLRNTEKGEHARTYRWPAQRTFAAHFYLRTPSTTLPRRKALPHFIALPLFHAKFYIVAFILGICCTEEAVGTNICFCFK
jgi:hypothetical protein